MQATVITRKTPCEPDPRIIDMEPGTVAVITERPAWSIFNVGDIVLRIYASDSDYVLFCFAHPSTMFRDVDHAIRGRALPKGSIVQVVI